MNQKVDCFFAFSNEEASQKLVNQFRACALVNQVFVLSKIPVNLVNCEQVIVQENSSCSTIRHIAKLVEADFALLALSESTIEPGHGAIERLIQVAEYTEAPMTYADYMEMKDGILAPHPLIGYQPGSLRDDFNFGPVRLYRADVLKAFR